MARDVIYKKANELETEAYKNVLEDLGWSYHTLKHAWVAVDGDKIAAYACAEFFREDNALATIAGVIVNEDYRGDKIGIQLCQHLINAFQDVSTWHLAGHSWIPQYYHHLGFKVIDEVIPELKRSFAGQVFMRLDRV